MFRKKAVFKNRAIFVGKQLFSSLFFNENTSPQFCNFIKKRLQHRCFPANIAKFLKALVLKNICELLLKRFPLRINNKQAAYEGAIFSKKLNKNTFSNSAR